jgi:hypothetical protein
MTAPRVSLRRLNRATLARQLLLERSSLDPIAALERVLGLQAQTPQTWYTGLWSRLADFDPAAFGALLESREAVRIALMRSTIHLVSARDALFLRPLMQSMTERSARSAFGKRWDGLELDDVAAVARTLLEESPLTFAELGAALRERWPDHDAAALAQLARTRLPLVQTPPRGVWGRSGSSRHTTAEAWLGRPLDAAPSIETMALRYFGAFGPASVRDLQAWCGLTRLGEVVDALRPRLVTFRDPDGAELFDLPEAPRPDEDVPAPVRFLYDYDNLLLSHANRSRLSGYDTAVLGTAGNGILPSLVLVDGTVRAAWTMTRGGGSAALDIRLLGPVSAAQREELATEAAAFLSYATAGAGDVRISGAPGVRLATSREVMHR